MKRLLTVGVFVLQGLGLAFSAAAVDGTDISGTVREVASGTATTVFENFTAASGDATIKLVPPLHDGRYIGNFRLYVTDVTVTIDATEVTSASQIRLSGDIVTYGTGKVIVKGVDMIAFGSASSPGYSSTGMPVLDADFTFEDATGDGLVLVNGVTLLRRPTCTFSIADGAGIGVRGNNILGDATDGLVVDHFNLFVADEPSSGQAVSGPITVSDGHWLVYKPCSISYNSIGGAYAWAGGDGTLSNDVCLAAGATLYVPAKVNSIIALAGAISGEGTIDFRNDSYYSTVEFRGDSSAFAGTLNMAHPTRKVIVKGDFACGQMNWSATNGTLTVSAAGSFSCGQMDCSTAGGALSVAGSLTCDQLDWGTSDVVLTVAADALASLGSVSGVLAPTGAGEVRVTALAANTVVHDLPSGTLVVADTDADLVTSAFDRLYVKPTVSNGMSDYAVIADELKAGVAYSMSAKDGVAYVNVPERVRIVVADGVSSRLILTGPTNDVSVAEGGNLTLVAKPIPDWQSHVMRWIDPSESGSWIAMKDSTETDRVSADSAGLPWYGKNVTYPKLRAITDKRVGERYRTWSLASDKANSAPTSDVTPLLVTNGLNGLTFLSFGKVTNRRTFAFDMTLDQIVDLGASDTGKVAGSQTAFYPQFAVLVYGSQGGGGTSMFAGKNAFFRRCASEERTNTVYHIFNNDIPTWRDGVRLADAREVSHSGSWNVFSVDCSVAADGVYGLGSSTTSNLSYEGGECGGQAYAEVIFFDKVLSDEERVAVELYLAEKWGLSGQYQREADVEKGVRIDGSGTVTVQTDATLEGGFAGTVVNDGHAVSVSGQPLPPSEEVVTAANPTCWFDPEYENALGMIMYKTDQRIGSFYDRMLGSVPPTGDSDMFLGCCGAERGPRLSVGSRGGWAKNWISHVALAANLRFRKVVEDGDEAQIINPRNFKTVFLVQDSSFGGGTPFQGAKSGYGRIPNRAAGVQPTDEEVREMVKVPIWEAAYYSALRDSQRTTTYLDGRPVDGATSGFGGKPEVFSVLSDTDVRIATFGNLYYNNSAGLPYPVNCGEVQSEIILFADKIGEEDRAKIEAYLAWKWLGEVREGYTSLHAAKLTGSGVVTIPAGAAVPQFGADFTGSVQLASDALAFTVTDADPATPVDGLIDVGGGTFAPQSPCTLTVTVADGVNLRSGAFYPLVMGAWADGVDVSLSIAADAKGRELTLESRDGVLGLAVGKPGLMLLVK